MPPIEISEQGPPRRASDRAPGAKTLAIASYRTLGALAIIVAIGYEVGKGLGEAGFSVTDFFSYFTELSNLFAAAVLIGGVVLRNRPATKRAELLRGASVLYMLTTGIVFAALLSGKHVPIPWVNTIVHQIMPAVVAIDWLVDPPAVAIELTDALWWLSFPLVYLIYTLIRGPIVRWYPYPFIDPESRGGYLKVAVSSAGIAVGQTLMIAVIAAIADRRSSSIRGQQPST
jgi:hypothetical protein